MTLAEKITSLVQRPNDDLVAKDDVPWWLRYTARGLGSLGGTIGLFLGVLSAIFSALGLGIDGILAGILLALVATTVIIAEAPCCCMFVDYVQDLSNWVEKRPNWNRSVYYMIASAVVFFMDMSLTKFVGCGLIFATGILYGMMALGKKAPMQEMRSNASVYSTNNQVFPPAAASNSNLVDGVQPVSFSNPFDSRV